MTSFKKTSLRTHSRGTLLSQSYLLHKPPHPPLPEAADLALVALEEVLVEGVVRREVLAHDGAVVGVERDLQGRGK